MSLRCPRARHRRTGPARPLAERLGRPTVVGSLAVVALCASVGLQAGTTSMDTGPHVAASAALEATARGGAPTFSLAGVTDGAPASFLAPRTHGGVREAYRLGTSSLDPTNAPSRLHTGELPVNTLVAPAQPVVIGAGGQFGWRTAPDLGTREFHNGSDISAPAGTAVVAAAQGEVTAVFWDVWGGNRVEITHAEGLKTTYSHLQHVTVRTGDRLDAAQQLGSVGATGIRVTGPHLHFETWVDGAAVDPQAFDWATDHGVLPATATPYSLSAQAPSPQETAAILDQIQAQLQRRTARTVATTAQAPATRPKAQTTPAPKTAPRPEAPAEPEARQHTQTSPAPPPMPASQTVPAPKPSPAAKPIAPTTTPAPVTTPTPAVPPPPDPSAAPRPSSTAPAAGKNLALQQRASASPTADTDADGILDIDDPDLDGDGLDNGEDPDIDGDGINNTHEAGPGQIWIPAATDSLS